MKDLLPQLPHRLNYLTASNSSPPHFTTSTSFIAMTTSHPTDDMQLLETELQQLDKAFADAFGVEADGETDEPASEADELALLEQEFSSLEDLFQGLTAEQAEEMDRRQCLTELTQTLEESLKLVKAASQATSSKSKSDGSGASKETRPNLSDTQLQQLQTLANEIHKHLHQLSSKPTGK